MTAPTYANDPNGILGTDILFEGDAANVKKYFLPNG